MKVWLAVRLIQTTALGNVVYLVKVCESLDDRPEGENLRFVPVVVGELLPRQFDLWHRGYDPKHNVMPVDAMGGSVTSGSGISVPMSAEEDEEQ